MASSDPKKRSDVYYRLQREAFEVLGGYRCCECGFDDPRALQIDHIDGDGYSKRKSCRDVGETLYRRIIRNGRDGYQVLCANCNWIKRAENGEHGKFFQGMTHPNDLGEQPKDGRASATNPEDTYLLFETIEPMGSITSRLRISYGTLRNWWLEKFGRDAYLSRAKKTQAMAVAKTGRANQGRRRAVVEATR